MVSSLEGSLLLSNQKAKAIIFMFCSSRSPARPFALTFNLRETILNSGSVNPEFRMVSSAVYNNHCSEN